MAAVCAIRAATICGVEAVPVTCEVDVGSGLPSFAIVGLPDTAVQEARERVRSAIRSSGFEFPNARVVVNLAPAPVRKHGTGFDLALALGVLASTGQIRADGLSACLVVGELSLDGAVRTVPGLLAHAQLARAHGLALLGPSESGGASLLGDLVYRPLTSLVAIRHGLPDARPCVGVAPVTETACPDFGEVGGNELVKRAITIAATGSHNLMMVGPPGSGKTMLARRIPGILPPLSEYEALETALVHSVAGLDGTRALSGVRPFRAPHHSASTAGLVGGGSPIRPGEVSLAHNGVLFLDEMPEFGPSSLQALRQPLEDGEVRLVRADGRVRLPARFALVGAANPCPCGFLGDASRECRCRPDLVDRYQGRVGGPLMDRFDMTVDVPRVDPSRVLGSGASGATSDAMREVVNAGRAFASHEGRRNAALSGSDLLAACRLTAAQRSHIEQLSRATHLSGRGITRLLRVARTIADVAGSDRVQTEHVDEAFGFRAKGSL